MPRPRKFVVDPRNHRTIDGLSVNRASREHYSIAEDGKRVYWGRDRCKAIDAFCAGRDRAVIRPLSDEQAVAELLDRGVPEAVINANPDLLELPKRGTFTVDSKWLDENPDKPLARLRENMRRAERGLSPMPLDPRASPDEQVPPSGKRLKDCLKYWQEWKRDERCSAAYIADAARCFNRFVQVVGNKRVNELSADHFAAWRRWIVKNSGAHSVKWANDHNKHAKAVLELAAAENPAWPFPDGLEKWASQWVRMKKRQKYVPQPANKKPLPPEAFKALLDQCKVWGQMDPEQFNRTTQRGRAQRLQAQRRRREGVQLAAILRLAANCALDNVDCARVPAKALKLEAEPPYLDFPREKSKRQTGYAVPRLIPLLPATVQALRDWLAFEPVPGAPTFFRNVRRNQFTHSDLNESFVRLRKAAKIEGAWTFKSLRNIGPSLRKVAGLPKEMSDSLLGHVTEGTSKFYEDAVDQNYLLVLVNLIGAKYFAVVCAIKNGG